MHAEQQASEKGSAATQIKLCNGGMQAVKRICHTCYKAILAPFSFLVQQPSSTNRMILKQWQFHEAATIRRHVRDLVN